MGIRCQELCSEASYQPVGPIPERPLPPPRYNPGMLPAFYREAQSLRVSSLGIGTYLGAMDEETDARYTAAVTAAIEGGINFIDTSLNYRHGRSERNIGVALRQVRAPRESLVICTKAGYLVPGAVPPLDPADIVNRSHCMTPAFLEDQLERSRRNLGVETVDVFYLHNPETQLSAVSQAEFEQRVRTAFAAMERFVQGGRIRFYGVATWNGFRQDGLLDIDRMEALAREVAGETHRFRFIQMPINLAMREALLRNVPQRAASLGITTVASATLLQSKLASGLPEPIRNALGSDLTDAQRAIQFARSAPGVTAALAGMSRMEHVRENLGVADVEPLEHVRF
jgi:aryl-alcohol dehydrogenase-like predicted oxidoreductase